uniref:Uncharacterized protein n=1 Tax=Timema monikensis TaxID=170555 RepID=A0A7R9E2C2_9NEOP|nr:unnamed protein product [Timema monikensis]
MKRKVVNKFQDTLDSFYLWTLAENACASKHNSVTASGALLLSIITVDKSLSGRGGVLGTVPTIGSTAVLDSLTNSLLVAARELENWEYCSDDTGGGIKEMVERAVSGTPPTTCRPMRKGEYPFSATVERIKMDKIQQMINIVDAVQTIKLCDLIVDQNYPVYKLKSVDTKLGRRLITYLDGELCVFLPCRFGTLTDEDVCDLNKDKLIFTCALIKTRYTYNCELLMGNSIEQLTTSGNTSPLAVRTSLASVQELKTFTTELYNGQVKDSENYPMRLAVRYAHHA